MSFLFCNASCGSPNVFQQAGRAGCADPADFWRSARTARRSIDRTVTLAACRCRRNRHDEASRPLYPMRYCAPVPQSGGPRCRSISSIRGARIRSTGPAGSTKRNTTMVARGGMVGGAPRGAVSLSSASPCRSMVVCVAHRRARRRPPPTADASVRGRPSARQGGHGECAPRLIRPACDNAER